MRFVLAGLVLGAFVGCGVAAQPSRPPAPLPTSMTTGDCGIDSRGDDLFAPRISDDVRAGSLRRFKGLLGSGGTMYVIDEDDRGHLACTTIQVGKGDPDDDVVTGEMTWIDADMSEDGEPIRVTASVQLYDKPFHWRHADDFSDPDYGVTYAEAFVSNGYETLSGDEGWALGCGDVSEVWGVENAVEIADNPHYFERSGCEQAIARERARRRWCATDENTEEDDAEVSGAIATSFGPGIGGC